MELDRGAPGGLANARRCPRDGGGLQAGSGALAEDVCPRCQGRFLDHGATHRLFVEILGIREDILMELARAGVPREPCPGCGGRLCEVRARSVVVDLCRGCGGSWLDGGELGRLARDVVEEICVHGAATDGSGLELDLTRAPALADLRFEVRCVSCDDTLDLRQVNWLINTRPWCPGCARPYTGWTSLFSGSLSLSSLLSFFQRGRWMRVLSSLDSTPLNQSADVLRIAPDDAERFFGPFFVRAR